MYLFMKDVKGNVKIKTRRDLIRAYIEFFKSKGHKEIPSASLIPENDPTALFISAGMQPLVPYLIGQKHPFGKRIVNVQKCMRTDDIDEVGDEVHHTFFEMLGNWSFGDYFKKEAIEWSFEYLTRVLEIPKEKLAVTCFGGDSRVKDILKDKESKYIWEMLGFPELRIAFLEGGVFESKYNWWGPAGQTGPCGPDTEMFYWTGEGKVPERFDPNDKKWVEIGNDVFMQYERKKKILLIDGMNCLYDKDFNVNQELFEFLHGLNVKKVLVVNNFKEKAEELLKNHGYEVFSFNGRITKDNPVFFQELISKYSIDKDEIIYFDHKNENLISAGKFGIKHLLLFDGNVEEIKTFVKENLYYFIPLTQKNVDFGGGVERTLAVLNGLNDNYETIIFKPIISKIEEISAKKYNENKKAMRIIADHLRAATFVLGDEHGVKPSNAGQGYVLRRLIRRAIRYGRVLGIEGSFIDKIAEVVIDEYEDYHELHANRDFILDELKKEEERFGKTLEKGLRKLKDFISLNKEISGKDAFLMFQSYGFPIEMTDEIARENGLKVDVAGFDAEMKKHQELSRTASGGMFKSGLADDSDRTVRLHTATHLLNEALRVVLGTDVRQRGSNITPERLRFDFNFPRKLTQEEINEVERLVNDKIKDALDVKREEMALDEAIDSGAQGEFGAKYSDVVSVYIVLDDSDKKGWFSREICTGPHVKNTSEVGKFRILKEESVSSGVRRIKATVE